MAGTDQLRSLELSVIIPARNEEHVLPEQLDALARQRTDVAWELIVVDNGSSDRTAEVAAVYQDRIPGLRVVVEPTPGLCVARDAGVSAATADHLVFCDADDVVCDVWVDAMARALRDAPIATGCHEIERLNDSSLLAMRGRESEGSRPTFHGVFPYAHGNTFGVRRHVYESLNGFDARFTGGEDIEFCMRAWWLGIEVGFAPDAVVHYRYRETPSRLWRQGFGYGSVRPAIRDALIRHGSPAPSALAGWRSWVWLIGRLPTAVTFAGRCNVAWVAGNRFGQLRGSLAARRVFL